MMFNLLIFSAFTVILNCPVVASLSIQQPRQQSRRAALTTLPSILASASLVVTLPQVATAAASDSTPSTTSGDTLKFQRYPQIRFIAALGDPASSQGTGADQWGLWRDDPGPRGVFLRNYESRLVKRGGVAPAGWKFLEDDWWLEEHGLIMANPESLPRKKYDKSTKEILPFKRYVVTGDREVTTVLTVFEDGRWELAKGTLYDVTHLPCRSARYTSPVVSSGTTKTCSPRGADEKMFPVKPGAVMPDVTGCDRQDYAVLFVLGEEA